MTRTATSSDGNAKRSDGGCVEDTAAFFLLFLRQWEFIVNREEGLQLVLVWVKNPRLINHCLCVEQVMRQAAAAHGGTDEDLEKWGLAGLLHDADWEAWPEDHPKRIVELLRDRGEEDVAHAIAAHGAFWGVPHRTPMDRALVASDELTGLVVACSLLRPDGILTLEPASVLKKMANPKFAAGVDRKEIAEGTRILGVDVAAHLKFIIAALRTKATELGLSGR
jgi:predicted hydrolase (HD superfamily)